LVCPPSIAPRGGAQGHPLLFFLGHFGQNSVAWGVVGPVLSEKKTWLGGRFRNFTKRVGTGPHQYGTPPSRVLQKPPKKHGRLRPTNLRVGGPPPPLWFPSGPGMFPLKAPNTGHPPHFFRGWGGEGAGCRSFSLKVLYQKKFFFQPKNTLPSSPMHAPKRFATPNHPTGCPVGFFDHLFCPPCTPGHPGPIGLHPKNQVTPPPPPALWIPSKVGQSPGLPGFYRVQTPLKILTGCCLKKRGPNVDPGTCKRGPPFFSNTKTFWARGGNLVVVPKPPQNILKGFGFPPGFEKTVSNIRCGSLPILFC